MPEPLTTYNLDLWVQYGSLGSAMLTFRNYFYYIGDQIAAQNWNEAKNQCYAAGDYYGSYVKTRLCDGTGVKGKVYACLDWIDDNWAGDGAEVTMDAIINAMLLAEFHDIEQFVGLVDAYRTKLWHAPFDFGFYNTAMETLPSWG